MNPKTVTKDANIQSNSRNGDQQPMSCARCAGLLVEDRFMDMEQGGFLWGAGWRCVNCGNIVFGRTTLKLVRRACTPSTEGDRNPVAA